MLLAQAIVCRLAEEDTIDEDVFDTLNDERMAAECALDHAITDMIERNTAMWEAHAEFRRLYAAEKPPLAAIN